MAISHIEGEREMIQYTLYRTEGTPLGTYDLHCPEDCPDSRKKGLAVLAAYHAGGTLCRADLQRADLSACHLRGIDFTGACLLDADLQDADLSNANLTGADLRGVYLKGTNLSGTVKTGSTFLQYEGSFGGETRWL